MNSERAESLRAAQILLPFLTLPAVVGALWLALQPQHAAGGATFLAVGAAVTAWYLLGGALSVRHLWRGLAVRRDLNQVLPAVLDHDLPAFAVGPDGLVLAQNQVGLDRIGDLVGRHVQDALGRRHADPKTLWSDLGLGLARSGRVRADLGDAGEYLVTRRAGSAIQLWQAAAPERPAPPPAPPPRADGDDFDLLPVSLLILDPAANIVRANAAACALLGGRCWARTWRRYWTGWGGNWRAGSRMSAPAARSAAARCCMSGPRARTVSCSCR
ncbi:PAS domain-containing protein [Paracoccus versutus]|uniref:PAS domain-containing protein n=1 Tax=Paracoccus versutus TaxID=34007 RepID=UPI003B8A70A2